MTIGAELVAALIDSEEATVKRLRIHDGRLELCPENPAYEPLTPDVNDLTILGKVIEVRRYLES